MAELSDFITITNYNHDQPLHRRYAHICVVRMQLTVCKNSRSQTEVHMAMTVQSFTKIKL